MASGNSGRASSGSKGFDFASDDILCSYEDYVNQDSSNGSHSDPGMGNSSAKDFHKSRLVRPMHATPVYSQPEDSPNQDMAIIVEKSMKKHTENLMRFLEGISSRLSQVELYCYNLDKSIGEMRSELNQDNKDTEAKLKSLDKHVQEVHRSVQILRDKQELVETQKELAKLQHAQKESSSANSHSNEERPSTPVSESKNTDNASDAPNSQLALALPHQVAPPQSVPPPSQAPPQAVSQQQAYYLPTAQTPNISGTPQHPQFQYVMSSDPQGRSTQVQDISRIPPPSAQSQVNQTPTMHPFPQYQQQWSQQLTQQVAVQPPPQQQAPVPPQLRTPPTPMYSPYPPTQSANPSPPPHQETIPSNMPMQGPYSGAPPPVSSRAETVPYGYGGPGMNIQQQPMPQPVKGSFRPQPADGYTGGPQNPVPPNSGYMTYEADVGRTQYQPSQQAHFSQGIYPPSNAPHPNLQGNPPSNLMPRNSGNFQFAHTHPRSEMIDKLVSMGFRGDHVAAVIQRMEESGQPVDFNAVLDRLNMQSSVGSQRGWSG
ncbi:hypothetical protein SAY87_030117 [Trapa incisa]|uniref:DUF1421 domain-containing protein n=1 Tax=Trapa incisa TaxID=236973 RepID=A0AAN7KCZ4_9MYRT|nr:hypothetical protein SAY87_030117 [Trapa incisa]